MPLFKIGQRLEQIKESPFKLELEIQQLTEKNLNTLLRLDFIRSEFSLNNFRIDTLAFDNEAKSIVKNKTFLQSGKQGCYLSAMSLTMDFACTKVIDFLFSGIIFMCYYSN